MHLTHYAIERFRLALALAAGLPGIRHRYHRLHDLAHRGESALHVAYLGGVAFGGGYKYAAIGILLCMAIAWFCQEE